MKILIADDESPKLGNLETFVRHAYPLAAIHLARSVRTAISAILASPFDLVILDMSLPTFDISVGEPGGRPQGFGGVEVLRHLDFKHVHVPIVVVTQYEAFTENGRYVSLSALSERLAQEHPSTFRGCIYYGALSDSWQSALGEKVRSILGG